MKEGGLGEVEGGVDVCTVEVVVPVAETVALLPVTKVCPLIVIVPGGLFRIACSCFHTSPTFACCIVHDPPDPDPVSSTLRL